MDGGAQWYSSRERSRANTVCHLHQLTYISFAVNKSSRMLWLIKKTFSCLDEDTLPRLYKALVRPHLEYGNIIWYPYYQMDKLAVERVQRRATKLVPYLKHLSYEQRLVALRLPSLLFRRRWGDMIRVYKIVNGIDRLDTRVFFNRALNERTRGHSQRLFVGRCRLEIRNKTHSASEWFRTGTDYQIMLSQPIP